MCAQEGEGACLCNPIVYTAGSNGEHGRMPPVFSNRLKPPSLGRGGSGRQARGRRKGISQTLEGFIELVYHCFELREGGRVAFGVEDAPQECP